MFFKFHVKHFCAPLLDQICPIQPVFSDHKLLSTLLQFRKTRYRKAYKVSKVYLANYLNLRLLFYFSDRDIANIILCERFSQNIVDFNITICKTKLPRRSAYLQPYMLISLTTNKEFVKT